MPDDQATVKCVYCGSEIVVAESLQITAGRVRIFTEAVAVEKRSSAVGLALILFGAACLLVIFGVTFSASEGEYSKLQFSLGFGAILVVVGAVILIVARPSSQVVGFRGNCPYCETEIDFPAHAAGLDCFACNKRIVFRDMKFFSVDTPVSRAQPR